VETGKGDSDSTTTPSGASISSATSRATTSSASPTSEVMRSVICAASAM
jgi:hypothetical protein